MTRVSRDGSGGGWVSRQWAIVAGVRGARHLKKKLPCVAQWLDKLEVGAPGTLGHRGGMLALLAWPSPRLEHRLQYDSPPSQASGLRRCQTGPTSAADSDSQAGLVAQCGAAGLFSGTGAASVVWQWRQSRIGEI